MKGRTALPLPTFLPFYFRVRVVIGIPIPKTIVIWASPSHINLAIWVRVRVTGDAHITRVSGVGMPKTRGCPYDMHITVAALSQFHRLDYLGAWSS